MIRRFYRDQNELNKTDGDGNTTERKTNNSTERKYKPLLKRGKPVQVASL